MSEELPITILDNEQIVVLQAQLGEWDNLNHLIVCKKTSQAVIIDPFEAKYWFNICENRGYNLSQAWLTHSHWDHAKGIENCLEIGGGNFRVFLHQNEMQRGWEGPHTDLLEQPVHTPASLMVGELEFLAHLTPGHTPGHLTFLGHGIVVSGDCLFLGRCGRTDLFGGDVNLQRETLRYLKHELSKISQDSIVLPGHLYALENGEKPSMMTVADLLNSNQALLAVDDDSAWNSLDFLAFDDSLAEKARRQRAMQS